MEEKLDYEFPSLLFFEIKTESGFAQSSPNSGDLEDPTEDNPISWD